MRKIIQYHIRNIVQEVVYDAKANFFKNVYTGFVNSISVFLKFKKKQQQP